MDFKINAEERGKLRGLPHLQQVLYYSAIRPYMDYVTGTVGVKRKISYQSLREEIEVFPHVGHKSPSFSRDQIRRAVTGLARAGLIEIHSEQKQLILKCIKATTDNSIQNKAATKPPGQAASNSSAQDRKPKSIFADQSQVTSQQNNLQAATPPVSGSNIFLSRQFEKFWQAYPQKRSRQSAEEAFNALAPEEALLEKILQAINAQKHERLMKEQYGGFIPHWKNPDNWLRNRCWEDEIDLDIYKEKSHGKTHSKTNRQPDGQDHLWKSFSEESYDEYINC